MVTPESGGIGLHMSCFGTKREPTPPTDTNEHRHLLRRRPVQYSSVEMLLR